MLPIALDLSRLTIVLVGTAEGLAKRQDQLLRQGATDLHVFSYPDFPSDELLERTKLILGVDLDEHGNARLADVAKHHNIILNIEDVMEHCDFHYASFMQRGDLFISVNTSGKSPTLTTRIKNYLAQIFDEKWEGRLNEIAQQRLSWRSQGLDYKQVIQKSNAYIDERGWLS